MIGSPFIDGSAVKLCTCQSLRNQTVSGRKINEHVAKVFLRRLPPPRLHAWGALAQHAFQSTVALHVTKMFHGRRSCLGGSALCKGGVLPPALFGELCSDTSGKVTVFEEILFAGVVVGGWLLSRYSYCKKGSIRHSVLYCMVCRSIWIPNFQHRRLVCTCAAR